MKLLYDLEYQVNEERKNRLSAIEYEDLSVKELLDLGFNDTFIKIDNNWYELGYKSTNIDDSYYSNDFGYLEEEQLKCMVKYFDNKINDNNYLEIDVVLVNEEDKKYFKESE